MKRKAIMDFSSITLMNITKNDGTGYTTGTALPIPYAGTMNRTPKERNGELYYDGKLYAVVNQILGEEVEIRVGEVSLDLLEDLGMGTLDATKNRLEANFNVEAKEYALRCMADTLDSVPFYFNWRVFNLTSLRFDNFKTKDTSVSVCEVIIKGVFREPALATVKPLAIMQLLDDKSNAAECTAFLTAAETFPAA